MIKRKIEEYSDVLYKPWPRESLRGRMPLKKRAKIFVPFAALNGYEESLEEVREKIDVSK